MLAPASTLPEHSRIWIYQSDRELTEPEENSIAEDISVFLESWTAHNQSLRAGFEIRHHRFLILMIDEKVAGASGCSIDKSVHFIQSLEKKYHVRLLDRMSFAYRLAEKVRTIPAAEFRTLFRKGELSVDTIVFNNLIQTKGELESSWMIPLKNSWHQTFVAG